MKFFKVSIVGCGRISKKHAEVLSSGQINQLKLISACDLKLDRAVQIGEKYNIPHH